MVLSDVNLRPTERRLFELLADGGLYTRRQVVDHLCDGDRTEESAVPYHISTLRAALRPHGLLIVFHNRGKHLPSVYQLVRRVGRGE